MAESTVRSDSSNTAKLDNTPVERKCVVTLLESISTNLVVRGAIPVIQIKFPAG